MSICVGSDDSMLILPSLRGCLSGSPGGGWLTAYPDLAAMPGASESRYPFCPMGCARWTHGRRSWVRLSCLSTGVTLGGRKQLREFRCYKCRMLILAWS